MEIQIVPGPNGQLNLDADFIILQDEKGGYYYAVGCELDIPFIKRMYYTEKPSHRIRAFIDYDDEKGGIITNDFYVYPCTIPEASKDTLTDVWRMYDSKHFADTLTPTIDEADTPSRCCDTLWKKIAFEAINGNDHTTLEAVYDVFSYRFQCSVFLFEILASSNKEKSMARLNFRIGELNLLKSSWES